MKAPGGKTIGRQHFARAEPYDNPEDAPSGF
jgi:hypothetical protein